MASSGTLGSCSAKFISRTTSEIYFANHQRNLFREALAKFISRSISEINFAEYPRNEFRATLKSP